MALERTRASEIPSDAVILSENNALRYHSKILSTWPNISDTYGYKYGTGILATAAMLSGMYVNAFFRRKFKLLHYGQIASYLPVSVMPAAISILCHDHFILRNLILKKYDCPVCLQTKSAALQAVTGCILPFLIAPMMSLSLVHRYHTFDMPYLTKEPMKVLRILRGQFGKMKNMPFGIFLGQALLASLVTYLEADSVYKVNMKLLEAEKTSEFAS